MEACEDTFLVVDRRRTPDGSVYPPTCEINLKMLRGMSKEERGLVVSALKSYYKEIKELMECL